MALALMLLSAPSCFVALRYHFPHAFSSCGLKSTGNSQEPSFLFSREAGKARALGCLKYRLYEIAFLDGEFRNPIRYGFLVNFCYPRLE